MSSSQNATPSAVVDLLYRRVAELDAERGGYREALQTIGTGCENFTGGTTCVSAGRTRGARYTAEAWCDQCIAREALDV